MKRLIEKGKNMNFFKIRLPGRDIESGFSEKILEIDSDNYVPRNNLNRTPGFIYSEFKESPELYLIPSGHNGFPDQNNKFTDCQADRWAYDNDLESEKINPFVTESTSHEEHIAVIEHLKSKTMEWRTGETPFTKAIASRISRESIDISPSEMFRRLCEGYPEACVFLFSTSIHGTWIGASPEIILNRVGNKINTVSLAGTKWNPAENWDKKNIDEQKIVTDFILETFRDFGLDPKSEGPVTLNAGPVSHLYTRIWANGTLNNFELLRHLCPTPALSGYPRGKAILAINQFETAPRQCYGGLIGLLEANGDFFTYANLRSGRFDSPRGAIELRAGGGITPLSEPEREWVETERKFETLRRIKD